MHQYLNEHFDHVKRNNMFNVESINIFSDASYSRGNKGSYGAFSTYRNKIIGEDVRWFQASTESINSLELRGIRAAVGLAFLHQWHLTNVFGKCSPISYINIFSDSTYSIDEIKRFIFTNDNVYNPYTHVFMRSANGIVFRNQDIMIEVVDMLQRFQHMYPHITLDIYWCPAHIKKRNNRQLKRAGRRFAKINCQPGHVISVDQDFMRYVCDSNDRIDRMVKKESRVNIGHMKERTITEPIKFYGGPVEGVYYAE